MIPTCWRKSQAGQELPVANGRFAASRPVRLRAQHTDKQDNEAMKVSRVPGSQSSPQQGAIPLLAWMIMRIGAAFAACGAIALYAVGTSWYWDALHNLPKPLIAFIDLTVQRARPLLAEDTAIAEGQVEFYTTWLVVCFVALLGWILAIAFRRHRLQRTAH